MLCFLSLTFVTFRVIRAPHAGANAQLQLLLENFKSKNWHNYDKKKILRVFCPSCMSFPFDSKQVV